MKYELFNSIGYNPFIDYLKGVCIIFVVLTHTISSSFHQYSLYCLWGDMAVPLFLLLQSYHAYKNGVQNVRLDINKVLKRVIYPFLGAQIMALFIIFLLKQNYTWEAIISELNSFGNFGAGAFYPYIYVWFAFILYTFSGIFKKLSDKLSLVFILCISVISEILCCIFDCEPEVYRFLPVRYIFIIYLGYKLSKDKYVKLNCKTVSLSIISAILIVIFNYTTIDFSPLFYTRSWRIFHWVSYFYVNSLLLIAIYLSYKYCKGYIKKVICFAGKYSYEIFLFQMLYFIISPCHILGSKFLPDYAYVMIYILDVFFCTIPILLFKLYFKKYGIYKCNSC